MTLGETQICLENSEIPTATNLKSESTLETEESVTATCEAQECCVYPFSVPALMGRIDPAAATFLEISSDSKIYQLLIDHLALHANQADRCSFGIAACRKSCDDDSCMSEEGCVPDNSGKNVRTKLSLGLGLFAFEFEGEECFALHARTGKPVGTLHEIKIFHSLVLLKHGRGGDETALLQRFCEEVILAAEQEADASTFKIYRWMIDCEYWSQEQISLARTMESVVLPAATKHRLMNDLEDFLGPATAAWYRKHGIPYKRSYLFYGSPGAGKTSLINAIAGKYGRNVCFLQPSHPKMTDDSLKSAVREAEAKSIIVLEDIDALFARDRTKGQESAITFSGLLNALDGIGGSSEGQIFIMTTNYKDRLDSALVRTGRVDMKIAFAGAIPEQMRAMFEQFYEAELFPQVAEKQLGEEFAKSVLAAVEAKKKVSEAAAGEDPEFFISTAVLQEFFIQKRKVAPEQAIAEVSDIFAIIDDRSASMTAEEEDSSENDGTTGQNGEEICWPAAQMLRNVLGFFQPNRFEALSPVSG